MEKPTVIKIANGKWAVINSTHNTKGAADKAANELKNKENKIPKQKLYSFSISEVCEALEKYVVEKNVR